MQKQIIIKLLKIMEENNFYLQQLSAAQKDLLVMESCRTKNFTGLKQMFEEGFPLDAFVLFCIKVNFCSFDFLKEVVAHAVVVMDSAKEGLARLFTVDEISSLYITRPELATATFPSVDDCVKYQLWDVLCVRGQWDIVAQHAPHILEQKDHPESSRALLNLDYNKYAPLAFGRRDYSVFLFFENGWKYLIDHGSLPVHWISNLRACGDLLPTKDIIKYCLKKGHVDEVYTAGYYDELLEEGQFEVFVKNRSFYKGFLKNYPNEVDWEDLWEHSDNRKNQKYLIEMALINKTVEPCCDFLLEHGDFWTRLMILL